MSDEPRNLIALHGRKGGNGYVCENCDHFYPASSDALSGQCRVVAPEFDEDGWAIWPKVHRENVGCSLHSGREREAFDDML